MSTFQFYLALLLWHLLYDWHWQGAFIAEWKGKHWFVMFIHSLTWACGLVFIMTLHMSLTLPFCLVAILYFTYCHFLIDKWKCGYETKIENAWTLYVDQFAHLVTVLCLLNVA